ncbi:MAG: hypothetical protein IPM69_02795 [Ignavibacteria bacterium]|nr:hypothetical protein [Ignavibacteria bacterium]
MENISTSRKEYFELSKHSVLQFFVLGALLIGTALVLQLYIAIPAMDMFFHEFLHTDVIKDGSQVEYRISDEAKPEIIQTSYYFKWAIVDNRTVDQRLHPQARYLFNPFLSLLPMILTLAIALAAGFSALLPQSLGLLRQKIEREIVNSLDRIARSIYGEHTDAELEGIIQHLLTTDIRGLHDYAEAIGVQYNEVETLQRAVRWQQSSGMTRLFRVRGAIKFYMRQYVTVQYSNGILGLVYIGAAALIIIIGIRGLKFIPPSEPSIILFALGLEFVLLLIYALTLMYSRQEDLPENIHQTENMDVFFGGESVSGSKEVEDLLRVFIAKDSKR